MGIGENGADPVPKATLFGLCVEIREEVRIDIGIDPVSKSETICSANGEYTGDSLPRLASIIPRAFSSVPLCSKRDNVALPLKHPTPQIRIVKASKRNRRENPAVKLISCSKFLHQHTGLS